eukprot:scaffold5067_cov139-Cylindrotheca_fusiformis.AAC.1
MLGHRGQPKPPQQGVYCIISGMLMGSRGMSLMLPMGRKWGEKHSADVRVTRGRDCCMLGGQGYGFTGRRDPGLLLSGCVVKALF